MISSRHARQNKEIEKMETELAKHSSSDVSLAIYQGHDYFESHSQDKKPHSESMLVYHMFIFEMNIEFIY